MKTFSLNFPASIVSTEAHVLVLMERMADYQMDTPADTFHSRVRHQLGGASERVLLSEYIRINKIGQGMSKRLIKEPPNP